jgi:hypothetical protein
VRGILEPTDADEIADRKDHEIHNFVTKSSQYAGDDFQLDVKEMDLWNNHIEEMDKVNEIKLVSLLLLNQLQVGEFDPAKIKYENVLIQLYRDIEDPFGNQLKSVKFT